MNFKNWIENAEAGPFPGSTVQHLVYHGTDKGPFKEFQYQKSQRFVLFAAFDVEAKGFFFSESPYDALGFGRNVVACYINLRKPLVDPRTDRHLGIEGFSSQKEIDMMKILSPMIEKDEGGHFIDYMLSKSYLQSRSRSTAREWLYDAVGSGGLVWDVLDNPGVVDKMKRLGYDGTFVDEPDTNLGRSIFVISPDQVRMVKWMKNEQEHWGDKDDWYTKKDKQGFENLYKPTY